MLNEIRNQYKRETGQQPTVYYTAEYSHTWDKTHIDGDLREFLDDGFVELFQFDYVRWLEEKVESLQKEASPAPSERGEEEKESNQ